MKLSKISVTSQRRPSLQQRVRSYRREMMRPVSVAAGLAFAACALDTASAFQVSGQAPLALGNGRTGLRTGVTGLRAKVLTVGGKKLSKFEAMRFKAGRYALAGS